MDIETAIMTLLRATTGVTALVGDRIYFVQSPQDTGKPYIVISKVDAPRLHSHEGADGIAHPRFQFSIFDEHYGDCKAVAAAIQAALQGYSGTMGGAGGVAVNGVFYEDENDFYEESSGLYHVACDYIIWHKE